MDTTIKVRVETRDELKILAAMQKRSMVDVVHELVHCALDEERQKWRVVEMRKRAKGEEQ